MRATPGNLMKADVRPPFRPHRQDAGRRSGTRRRTAPTTPATRRCRARAALCRGWGRTVLLLLAGALAVTDVTAQDRPTVSLRLSPDGPATIDENGGVLTVTARLDRAATATVAVTLTVAPAGDPSEPAAREDYVVSADRVLTFPPGSTASTGAVTITAVDDDADGATHKRVRVGGVVTTGNADFAGFRELLIRDDEDPPAATMVLTPPAIDENGGVSTVTAMLDHPARGPVRLLVQVALPPAGQSADARGYVLSRNRRLTIAQGSTSSTGRVTITAVDDDDHQPPAPGKLLYVRGYREDGVTSALVTPWRKLEIVDDERATPVRRER